MNPHNQGAKQYARSLGARRREESVGRARVEGCSLRAGSAGDSPQLRGTTRATDAQQEAASGLKLERGCS